MNISHSIHAPPYQGISWSERWEGPDQGLICAWLNGIEKAIEDSTLAQQLLRGELPILAFRGGVAKTLKTTTKLGSLHYLAFRQGIRGEDLFIDQDSEPQLTCSRFNVTVTYTGNVSRLLATQDLDEDDA